MPLQLARLPARSDFVDSVYRALLDAITDGSLSPGERLTQEDIAEQLRVSRSPVLQALRLLKKDGYIEDAPGRGVQVAPLDPERIGQLYEVRGALDALAVRLAAARGATLDPALIARGREAAERGVLRDVIEADMGFHNAIYEASGNPLIAESTGRYWGHLRRVMGAVHRAAPQRSAIWDEHQAIADAIARRDVAQAVALTEQHVEQARHNLVRRLGELLGAGPQAARHGDAAATDPSATRPTLPA